MRRITVSLKKALRKTISWASRNLKNTNREDQSAPTLTVFALTPNMRRQVDWMAVEMNQGGSESETLTAVFGTAVDLLRLCLEARRRGERIACFDSAGHPTRTFSLPPHTETNPIVESTIAAPPGDGS
jgi:hypothetical protein